MSEYTISLIRGDGVGPEVTAACLSALEKVTGKVSVRLLFKEVQGGDGCLEKTGKALPDASIETITGSDACIKGPVGKTAADVIVRLRQQLDLYANVRPAKCLPGVASLDSRVDMVIIRENTEDLYKGIEMEVDGGVIALRSITRKASERISRFALELSRNRKKKVMCIHKNNVMKKSDGLFLSSFYDVARSYPDVVTGDMLVDAAAMNFIRKPADFDVVVTTNMYGDILSDETAQVAGGLGLAPSANIGDRYAIFEPVHGSAPDIAGTGTANPTAIMLSAAMMLDWLSRTRSDEACGRAAVMLEEAVRATIAGGTRTRDIGGTAGTADFAAAVCANIPD